MRLTVNGIEHEIESAPLTPLLYVLREELGITSPKAGCQQGGCGACTVLVDGEPRRACLLAGRRGRRRRITTSKASERPRRSRRSRPRSTSITPRSAASARRACSSPLTRTSSTAAARARVDPGALSGHVCRCTGYVKIIDAVAAAAGGEITSRQQWLPQTGEESPVEVPGAPA